MKKKLLTIGAIILIVLVVMFVEYRFIMINLCPYVDNDTVYIDFFGQVDEYDLTAN